jgi:acyl-coenzyme A thioesterase PaaI-like protein
MCDTACGFAALSVMPDDAAVLTTEFKINLLSPAKGERFIAIGRVVRPGRKLMVCLGEAFAEEGGSRKQIANDSFDDGSRYGDRTARLKRRLE